MPSARLAFMMITHYRLAHETKDAYSFAAYGIGGWTELARLLIKHGLTVEQAAAILRSKWTRWASDQQENRYGRKSGRKAFTFLLEQRALHAEELAELVAA